MDPNQYYSCLGVDPSCSMDDIKRAYRKAAATKHPDRGGTTEEFQKLQESYEVLSNPERRNQYDNPVNNIFFQFMSESPAAVQPDRHATHTISFADNYRGCSFEYPIEIQIPCRICRTSCNACDGQGSITRMVAMGPMMIHHRIACMLCQGVGSTATGCNTCSMNTYTTEYHTMKCDLPAGVESGSQIRFTNMGVQPSQDGQSPGNFILTIEVEALPDDWKRNGDDLLYFPTISWMDSVCGTLVHIPLFHRAFTLNTATIGVIDPMRLYNFANMGYGGRGQLRIQFKVVNYPTTPIKLN